MTHIHSTKYALTIAAAMALGACSQNVATNQQADANAAIEPAPVAADDNAAARAQPAAVPAGSAPTADYMVGKWSASEEDCAQTLDFRKDGTVATPVGEAKWTLVGDQLGVDFGDGAKPDPTTVKVLSQDKIEITLGSGRKDTQKRC